MLNLNNRDLLATTLQAEAGNQGPVGMMSVGSVIMNRLKNPAYGSDLHQVILQPGQFSAWNNYTGYASGVGGLNMNEITPGKQAYMVADQILDGNYNDPTGGALHYYNPNTANPAWGQRSGGQWKQIGDHLFGFPGTNDPNRRTAMNVNSQPVNLMPQQTAANPPKRGLFDFIGKAVGGSFSGLRGALDGSDPDKSDRLAIALMSLSGNPRQLQPLMQMAANDIQERKKLKTQNKSIEYLRSVNPELARMAENNPSMVGNILSAYASQQIKGKGNEILTGAQLSEVFPNANLKPDSLYNVTRKDGQIVQAKPVNSSGITIGGEMDPFVKESQKMMAKDFNEIQGTGRKAVTALGQVKMLDRLLEDADTGLGAGLKQFAFDTFGVDVRDDAAIAANAIISQLVPQQRPPGTGPMSDADLQLFKNSLPSIAARPGGNKIIIETMKSIAAYQVKMGDIARKAMYDANYSTEQAYADMMKLEDPLAQAFVYMDGQGLGTGGDGTPKQLSPEEIEAYKTLGIPVPGGV